jgi:hypothetical protein
MPSESKPRSPSPVPAGGEGGANFPRRRATGFEPAEPLWQRVPLRDEDGRALGDFMMLIPGLRRRPAHAIEAVVRDILDVLHCHESTVVFADLNLKLEVLWVSVRPRPGACLALAAAIHTRIPGAKLIAAPDPRQR